MNVGLGELILQCLSAKKSKFLGTSETGVELWEIMNHVKDHPEIIKSRHGSPKYPSRAQKDKVRRFLNNSNLVIHNGEKTHKKRYEINPVWVPHLDPNFRADNSQVLRMLFDEVFVCNEMLGGSASIDDIASLMFERSRFAREPDCTSLPKYLWDYENSLWPEEVWQEIRKETPLEKNSPDRDFLLHLKLMIKNNTFPIEYKWDTTEVEGRLGDEKVIWRTPKTSAHLEKQNIDLLDFIRGEDEKLTRWHTEHWFMKNHDFIKTSHYGFQGPKHLKHIIRTIENCLNYVDIQGKEIPDSIEIKKELQWIMENKNLVKGADRGEKNYFEIKGKKMPYHRLSNRVIITLAILNLNRTLLKHYPMISQS